MSVGRLGQSVVSLQGVVQLLSSVGASPASGALSPTKPSDPWSVKTSGESVSARAIAKIQELVEGGSGSSTASARSTDVAFTQTDGTVRLVPQDEYDWITRTGQSKTLEEQKAQFIAGQLNGLPQIIQQLRSQGYTEKAEAATKQLESLQRSVRNGTVTIEALDPRVKSDHAMMRAIRDDNGTIIGMGGPSPSIENFEEVYGNGTGLDGAEGYDRNFSYGDSFWLGIYVISWEK